MKFAAADNQKLSNGQTRKVRTRLQDDQVGHDPHPMELQSVPLWPALVHLRVRQVQAQGMPALHRQSIGTCSHCTEAGPLTDSSTGS